MNEKTGRETLGGGAAPKTGAQETGAAYGNAQGYGDAQGNSDAGPGGGMDSSGGTGSDGGMSGGQSGAGYGDQGQPDQAVQRSETIDAEDIELEADPDLIDNDDA